jgi:glycosyltransferase involved in cell wall biosynthesis
MPLTSRTRAGPPDDRLRVVGHPTAAIGMGEHARSVWRALTEVGLPAGLVDIYGPQGVADVEFTAPFAQALLAEAGTGVNIYCINGDEVEGAFGHMRHRNILAKGSRNIIYPAWELERYPAEWAKHLQRFDEIWAPSAFIRDAIARTVTKPVVHMPLACEVRRRGLRSRRRFGVRDSAYAFLFAFDFLSYVERKNPFAVIEAFRGLVKERPFQDVTLVIKTNNSDRRPEMAARFEAAVRELRDHIVVIDATLSELEMKALIGLCDCFVSLHRSEGFGRGLSEAMALGKPVIATAYSGNMDFCNEATARLVPYALVPVGQDEYPHWEDQHWADADVEAATRAMRDLVDDPASGRALGARARAHLMKDFSYLAIGLRYMKRLEGKGEEPVSRPH